VCLVLLLNLLLLFEKPKANQTHWLLKAAFPLKAAPLLLLVAMEVGNFEKITHPSPSKN